MLKLNEVDIPRNNGDDSEQLEEVTEESSELQKCRAKVKELLDKLQKETSAKQIDLDFVSVSVFACWMSDCMYSYETKGGVDGGERGEGRGNVYSTVFRAVSRTRHANV